MEKRPFSEYLLRLSDVERQQLNLVIAALKVSEYTDEVDDVRYRQHFQESRMVKAMQNFFDTLMGLAIASDAVPKKVRDQLIKKPVIGTYAGLLGQLLEVARRHKQLNPTSNRCEFGKLMMILQDAQKPSVQQSLGLESSVVLPLKTVGGALHSIQREELLSDPEVERYVAQTGSTKAALLKQLVNKYDTNADEGDRLIIERCVRSIDDVESFIMANIDPLITLQTTLKQDFMSSSAHSLAISRGKGGSCLTHSHEQHCQYVMESLVLWEIVQRNIFLLWRSAERDMLFEGQGRYQFVNTGQGFQRMCSAPNSYSIMSKCVKEAQKRMDGQWVGIQVIHVGDRDVPNPLVFIDKYTQIPGLVHPITQTIKQLRSLFGSLVPASSPNAATEPMYPGVSNLLRQKFKSFDDLRTTILADFFRYGFDGSGDDGGSCIDGRLTSAWNWCQQLSKKKFYEAFLLTGFLGFG